MPQIITVPFPGRSTAIRDEVEQLLVGAKTNPFIDPEGYRKLIETMEQRFEAALERQSAK